jgi:hypothetical protein
VCADATLADLHAIVQIAFGWRDDGRASHHGLVAILSAMEPCSTYKPWHDKGTGKTYLRPDDGKCLHYYFYFIDEQLGLCYLRVPTWCPFRLKFYCNGHFWLAAELSKRQIAYRLADNAFASVGDFTQAQRIADDLRVKALHRKLGFDAQSCSEGHFSSRAHRVLEKPGSVAIYAFSKRAAHRACEKIAIENGFPEARCTISPCASNRAG